MKKMFLTVSIVLMAIALSAQEKDNNEKASLLETGTEDTFIKE